MTRPTWRRAVATALIMLAVTMAGCVTSGEGSPRNKQEITLGAWGGKASFVTALGEPAGGAGWPAPFDAPATFADVDGDGRNEIITTSRDRLVRVFSSQGTLLASMTMTLPPSWHIDQWLNGVAVGTLSPGGPASIVAATPGAGVVAWEYQGTGKDGKFIMNKLWDTRLDECHRSPGMDASPVLRDVDGDGADEVFLQVEQIGLFGLSPDGRTLWKQCWAGGNADAVLDDLDDDGDIEVVFASDSGFVAVLDAATGQPQWTFDARQAPYFIEPASIPVKPTIAELDGTAPKEILFTARYAPNNDADSFDDFHMAIFAIHQNLRTWQAEVLWMVQPDWAHPLSYTPLVVADVDDDGRPDIFGMDWNTIGHQPGNWEHLGDANVFRLSSTGRDVWVRPVESWWSNKEIVLADVDGDGAIEVLANGVGNGGDGLVRLDAETGATEGFLSAGIMKVAKGPTLGTVQAGGQLHLALPVGPLEGRGYGAILLYDLGVSGAASIQEGNQ